MRPPKAVTPREAAIELLSRQCRASFEVYAKTMFRVLTNGSRVIWGNHHAAMCQHLQAQFEGRIHKLGISVPPGSSKTSIVTILFPTWVWLHHPSHKFISSSHDLLLSFRNNAKRGLVVKSDLYQKLFKPEWNIIEDSKTVIVNSEQGEFRATSTGSGITGHHAHTIIIDDPLTATQALGEERQRHILHYTEQLDSRRVLGEQHKTILVMQRLCPDDLIGYFIETNYLDVYLCIPCEYDPSLDQGVNKIGWKDWRTEVGESINEEMYPQELRDRLKKQPRTWSTQYQQLPVAGEGAIINLSWWKTYNVLPEDSHGYYIGAWDLTFGKGSNRDYVAGQVWFITNADAYLVDAVCERMSFTEQLTAMASFAAKHPKVTRWYVEAAANGEAAIDILKRHIRGLIPWKSSTNKIVRIASISSYVESGNVFLPNTPEAENLKVQGATAPAGRLDAIDCCSIALITQGRQVGTIQQTSGSPAWLAHMQSSLPSVSVSQAQLPLEHNASLAQPRKTVYHGGF